MTALVLMIACAMPVAAEDDENVVMSRAAEQRRREALASRAWDEFLAAAKECQACRVGRDALELEASRLSRLAKDARRRANAKPSDEQLSQSSDQAAAKARGAAEAARRAGGLLTDAVARLRRSEAELAVLGHSPSRPPVKPRFAFLVDGERVLATQVAETSRMIALKAEDGRRIVVERWRVVTGEDKP